MFRIHSYLLTRGHLEELLNICGMILVVSNVVPQGLVTQADADNDARSLQRFPLYSLTAGQCTSAKDPRVRSRQPGPYRPFSMDGTVQWPTTTGPSRSLEELR